MFSKARQFRNYLVYQIFVSFLVTIALILAIALTLPTFDARTFNPLEEETKRYFLQESKSTEEEFNLDEIVANDIYTTNMHGHEVIILDRQNNKLVGIRNEYINILQAFMLQANDHHSPLQRRFGTDEIYGPFLVHASNHSYYQYFIKKVHPQREFINYMFDSPWIMLLILLSVSTPILLWLSYRISKPVRNLTFTAKAVATGNLSTNPKLESEGINELRDVGRSFNQMIISLQKLSSYQQRLLSDISHELKTPLTRMQLALSLIRRRTGESSEITRIENEIQKLNTMILDLLALSREQVNQHLNREIFMLPRIWEDVFEDARFEFEQGGFELFISQRISYPERYFINGNPTLLASALENVIRNAKKYAKNTVKVMIYIERNHLNILIDDDGHGVPKNQYEEIFRPFYRVAEDRARQTGGTGLGLAIVANAIRQHQGIVHAEQSPLGGLRIKIQLPLWLDKDE